MLPESLKPYRESGAGGAASTDPGSSGIIVGSGPASSPGRLAQGRNANGGDYLGSMILPFDENEIFAKSQPQPTKSHPSPVKGRMDMTTLFDGKDPTESIALIAPPEIMSPIYAEILESLRVEPIAINKPNCKEEVRLRYRVTECLWYPLIGTRHMKSFSISKFGAPSSWALARASAYYMQKNRVLPPGFKPTFKPITAHIVGELQHYVTARLSGKYGGLGAEDPQPIPPKSFGKVKDGRGRRKLSNVSDLIIYQSYELESKIYAEKMLELGKNGGKVAVKAKDKKPPRARKDRVLKKGEVASRGAGISQSPSSLNRISNSSELQRECDSSPSGVNSPGFFLPFQ